LRFWPIFLLAVTCCSHAVTLDIKQTQLDAGQRAALRRHLAQRLPESTFDWRSLQVHALTLDKKRQPLVVKLTTANRMSTPGVCRNEQYHLQLYPVQGKKRVEWRTIESLTRFNAWLAQDDDCAVAATPIAVDQALNDSEILFLIRQQDALRSRAAGVIGGSDCARIRFCDIKLGRISRIHQEHASRSPRVLTTLTFLPSSPGPSCLYVMELSFVGPINDLSPLGAACPKP
jgi:hypothetical protein